MAGEPICVFQKILRNMAYKKSDHFFLSGRKVRFNGECITQVRVYIRYY